MFLCKGVRTWDRYLLPSLKLISTRKAKSEGSPFPPKPGRKLAVILLWYGQQSWRSKTTVLVFLCIL